MKVSSQRKNSIILFAIILFAAVLLFLFDNRLRNQGDYVIVEQDSQITERLPLWEDTDFTITGNNNEVNELVIADGSAYVESANCSNQICVHTRPVSKGGQSIICLPHKVHIYVESSEEGEIDVIAN